MIHLIFFSHSNYIKITPKTQTYVPVFTRFILCLSILIKIDLTTFISSFHTLSHTINRERMFFNICALSPSRKLGT